MARKKVVPMHEVSIVGSPDLDAIIESFKKKTPVYFRFKTSGGVEVKHECLVGEIGRHNAFGFIKNESSSSEDDDLFYGKMVIFTEERSPEVRSFEFLNPVKETGELLAKGEIPKLKNKKKK